MKNDIKQTAKTVIIAMCAGFFLAIMFLISLYL